MKHEYEKRARRAPGRRLRLTGIALAVATLSTVAMPAHADEISDLKAQIQALNKRLEQIEANQKAAAAAPAPAPVQVAPALTTDQQGVKYTQDNNGIKLYDDGNTTMHIYGIIEPTISHASHQAANGAGTTGYQVSWFSGNRLGFDADHALPGLGGELGMPDLKIISKLESEFELPTGNMDTANVFFNRDAWAGVYSDSLGKLTFGRQNTLTRDFTQDWGDPYGTAETTLKEGGYTNVNNFKQFIFYSGGATGTRYNSSIVWKKNWDDHWVFGAGYAFGSGGAGGSGDVGNGGSIPGDFANGTTQAASVAYNKLYVGPGYFDFNASYDRANVKDLVHKSELFGGNYVLGPFRLNAGFVHYTAQQGQIGVTPERADNSWTTSASYFVTRKTELDLGLQDMKGKNAGLNAAGRVINPFGNTSGVTTVVNGDKKSIYGSAIYHEDRQTDFYVAADYFKVNGNWVVGDAQGNGNSFGAGQPYKSETELAVGVRYKF